MFDLQLSPTGPGLSLHRLENVQDKHFWSVRVNKDIRLIVHRAESSFLLCYVDHHDDACRWVRHRKIERHPTTSTAQIVETRETARKIDVKKKVIPEQPNSIPVTTKPALFAGAGDKELLSYGAHKTGWIRYGLYIQLQHDIGLSAHSNRT